MRLAFFDVDYTLYKGFSVVQFFEAFANKYHKTKLVAERKKLEQELGQNQLDQQQLIEWSMSLAARVVEGLSREQVRQQVIDTIKEKGKFFPWVNALLAYLRQNDFRIYLISASIEPMIAEIANQLKITHYFATILEQVDEIYTGKVLEVRNAHNKLNVLNQVIAEISEKNDVIAFGDSNGDVAMLSAADQGFVVDPVEHCDKIIATAKKKDWPILKHETALEQVKLKLSEKFGL